MKITTFLIMVTFAMLFLPGIALAQHVTHEHHYGPTMTSYFDRWPVNHANNGTYAVHWGGGTISESSTTSYSGSGGIEFGVDDYCQIKFGVSTSESTTETVIHSYPGHTINPGGYYKVKAQHQLYKDTWDKHCLIDMILYTETCQDHSGSVSKHFENIVFSQNYSNCTIDQ